MLPRVILFLISMMFAGSAVTAQVPLMQRTPDTDREALRLMRKDKLDLILPGAMRDNNVDMWIFVGRYNGIFANPHSGPLALYFGPVSGYLIFTDLGDKIERAVFGEAGVIENIDKYGSNEVGMALGGWNYNNTDPRLGFTVPEIYNEITEFIANRDPKTIAVNTSDWLPVADGISHSSYLKPEKILGSKYSQRIVSAENVILDFANRRTSREIAAQVEVLALARQQAKQGLSRVVPGKTRVRDVGARVYYSAGTKPSESVKDFPPDVRRFLGNPNYVLQPGDFFVGGGGGGGPRGGYMDFGVDTKVHAYILKEGETKAPDFIQKVFDKAIAGQWIMRDHMKVGMTAGESFNAMVKALEDEGYVHTPFTDDAIEDYKIVQEALKNKGTDIVGFSIDNHAFGNLGEIGPSMSPFRRDTHYLTIQENHLFAFKYEVHINLPEHPVFQPPIIFQLFTLFQAGKLNGFNRQMRKFS